MATYYVGSGGSDASAGTSWATRFLTIAKAATVVSAGGDIVYVGPGTYREQVTMTVSGGNTYSTGTVAVTNGSTIVTGSSTLFVTGSVAANDYFKPVPTAGTTIAGAIKIASVDSETQITLSSAYDGPTVSGLSYITWRSIQWIGDYGGTNTDGVGGVVRITGSADDISASRVSCITASSVNYNRVVGFAFDLPTSQGVNLPSAQYWIIDKCHFQSVPNGNGDIVINGASQLGLTVQNCYFGAKISSNQSGGVSTRHSTTLSNIGHVIQNCVFDAGIGATNDVNGVHALVVYAVGGTTFRNNIVKVGGLGVEVYTALAAGQTIQVINNLFLGAMTALEGTATTEIIEDYNTFSGNATNRTNTNVGANSITYPPLFDTRWFFELTA